jgi:hypothetical protein
VIRYWLSLAALLLVPPAHASKSAHVPDWVRDAARTPTPHLRPHDGAAVLLDQTDITVDPQGRAVVHHREVIRLLTFGGRPNATYTLFYEKGSKVHYVHSWTIAADEHEYQLDDKEMTDASAVPEFAIFDSTRVRVAQATAAEPGAIVAFESEYQEAPYMTSWEYAVDREIPSAGQTITLTLPAGFVHHEGWAHMDPIQSEQLAPSTWRWQVGSRTSLDDEDGAPELGEVAARMLVAYSGGPVPPSDGDWSTVGTWYNELIKGQDASSPEIAAKVAELTAGKATFSEKLLAITGFLQDEVRYVAVEMGIGGWQPHPAPSVFHNRYGDCKDKATLLIAMLADAGITAHPLVVDFDHRVDPAMPTHYANHMITAIEIPPGVHDPSLQAVVDAHGRRLLIFDPTNPVSPAGSLEAELQGSYGLILEGSASIPILLPVLTPSANVLVRTGDFTLAADGSLSGNLTEERHGNTADRLRHMCLQGDTRKLEEREARSLHYSLSNSTLSDLSAEHARERSMPLSIRYHVVANGYAKRAGSLLLVRPSVVGLYEPVGVDNSKPRLYPVALGAEQDLREDYTIHLPPGYKADDLPDPVKLEVSFASFENAVTLEGNTLHYTRDLQIRKLEVPAAEFAAYQDFLRQISNAERSEAVLKLAQ